MSANIASRDCPLFWPERGLQVYMENNTWYLRNPDCQWTTAWRRGSLDFGRDAMEAYANFELRLSHETRA